jgi:hypothetical protein
LALIVVLIGAEYVRAAASHRDTIGGGVESGVPAALVAAELDPVFMQKLTDRSRARYQRSHPLNAQP